MLLQKNSLQCVDAERKSGVMRKKDEVADFSALKCVDETLTIFILVVNIVRSRE